MQSQMTARSAALQKSFKSKIPVLQRDAVKCTTLKQIGYVVPAVNRETILSKRYQSKIPILKREPVFKPSSDAIAPTTTPRHAQPAQVHSKKSVSKIPVMKKQLDVKQKPSKHRVATRFPPSAVAPQVAKREKPQVYGIPPSLMQGAQGPIY